MKSRDRVLFAVIGLLFVVQAADAQRPQAKDAPTTPNELAVVPLKHSNAAEIAQVLAQLYGDQQRGGALVVSQDQNTNSVIISAQPARIAEIRELITKIDAPAARAENVGPPLRVFALRNIRPDKSLEEAVRLAIGSGVRISGKVAFDRERNQVIVSADEPTLKVVEALIARLDVAVPIRPVEDVQLRVVWLVKSPAPEDFMPPPDDLKEVLPALAKLGIDKPRLAAQSLINVSPNSQFRADGTVKLSEQCRFSITGMITDRSDGPGLNISLRATESSNYEICNVSTEIKAPIGHFVVLGVTPTRSLTSAFVVQVLRKESPKPQ